jgi:hypothetical protein
MKQTVGFADFVDAFHDHDRFDNFGYMGLKALYEYLEQYEEDCGEEIELDVIALCCDYSQYDSAVDAAKELLTDHIDREEGESDDDYRERMLDELRDNTQVIEYDGGIIVQSF